MLALSSFVPPGTHPLSISALWPVATRAENDGLVEKLAADAIVGHQRLAQRYVSSALDPASLSSEEASKWIQTGLTLTPFAFAETRHSVDWAIAWAIFVAD